MRLRLPQICVSVGVLLCALGHEATGKPLFEGDVCGRGEDGKEWRCRSLRDCPHHEQTDLARNGCYSGSLVCCGQQRPARAAGDTSIARAKCKEYGKYVYLEIPSQTGDEIEKIDLCQISEPLVTGGNDTEPNEYPHMALIGYGPSNNKQWFCGGTLISERFVMSAAHCTSPDEVGDAKWVRLGEYDLSTTSDDTNGLSSANDFEIVERINHPDYSSHDKYNDIALYKLDRDVDLGENIRPVCLHTEYAIDKPKVLATGWGNIKPGKTDTKSSTLKKTYLPIASAQNCKDSYKSVFGKKDKNGHVILKQGITDESMLCAGGEIGKDTCRADSGGPLQIRLVTPHCMYSQVGITSFGKDCGGPTPGIYTRVSHYVPWIEKIVWP